MNVALLAEEYYEYEMAIMNFFDSEHTFYRIMPTHQQNTSIYSERAVIHRILSLCQLGLSSIEGKDAELSTFLRCRQRIECKYARHVFEFFCTLYVRVLRKGRKSGYLYLRCIFRQLYRLVSYFSEVIWNLLRQVNPPNMLSQRCSISWLLRYFRRINKSYDARSMGEVGG